MKKILLIFLFAWAGSHAFAQNTATETAPTAAEPLNIVFQLQTSDTLVHKSLMNQLGNLLTLAPDTRIEVVCHGPGLTMLHKEETTVAAKVEALKEKGIVFNVCEFTMKQRKLTPEQMIPSASFVRGGILHIVTRQQEGWSYIKSGF